ncbi:MAG: amino acid ABC transporter substrate-binding protein [Myxococcales bacterium]|nr:MAG: amino acid ABC transporter substrate-binding protein [Myxococcales bacterium]
MIRTRTGLLLGTLCAALSIGCGSDDDEDASAPNAIHIGALTDETGPSASPLYRNAVSLASKQMNQALANAGSKVRFAISFADSQSNGPHSQESATDLINTNKVVGLVTDISGDTVSVNTLNYQEEPLADYKVPITCYLCSAASINNPEAKDADPARQAALRDEDNWLFRTFFNAKYEAAVQTQILLGTDGGDRNGDGLVKVGVYAIDDPYGQSSAAAVKAAVSELVTGESAVEVVFFNPMEDLNSYDFGEDLGILTDASNADTGAANEGEPDAIFLALLSGSSSGAVKAYREGDYQPPLFATTAFRRNAILSSLGSLAEGVQGNSPPLVSDDASGKAFQSAFEENGDQAEMGCSGAYDSTVALMLASIAASVDLEDPSEVTAEAVREAMARISDPEGEPVSATVEDFQRAYEVLTTGGTVRYDGASGATNYNESGDATPVLVHWEVEQKKFIETDVYDCSSDELCAITP